jgi:hypothetical protein
MAKRTGPWERSQNSITGMDYYSYDPAQELSTKEKCVTVRSKIIPLNCY